MSNMLKVKCVKGQIFQMSNVSKVIYQIWFFNIYSCSGCWVLMHACFLDGLHL